MLSLTANELFLGQKGEFIDSEIKTNKTTKIICNFCGRIGLSSSRYNYCFQCSCILC